MSDELRDDGFEDDFHEEADDNTDDAALPGEAAEVRLPLDGFTFETLIGFDEEIARIRDLGLVDDIDEEYLAFVEQMKKQHGIFDEPTGDVIVFSSTVREDADRLMIACANELGRPTMRMRVVDGPLGTQALIVMASNGIGPDGFKDWGTLVLEGVDTWGSGAGAALEGMKDLDQATLREAAGNVMKAIAVIRSAIANPKVAVFASVSGEIAPHSPLSMLLGSATLFEVPAPSDSERDAIWDYLMDKHVSMSALDRFELVKLSRGMPRCDIFSAAKEAVVQAYRESLQGFSYVPVTRSNLLDKIAAYQPLDSLEYRQIEDSVVEDFMTEIERMERGES